MSREKSDNLAVIAQTRFGWGAKQGGLQSYGNKPKSKLLVQLSDENLPPLTGTETSTFDGLLAAREVRKANRSVGANDETKKEDQRVAVKLRRSIMGNVRNEERQYFENAINSNAEIVGRLLTFWANHFAISSRKNNLRAITSSYVREAIRPHVFGTFHDMLNAVIRHPGMLEFLDNTRSIGPNSKVGKRTGQGINENLAREILELHTLGIDGAYNQSDVTAFSHALTGWTYRLLANEGQVAQFRFAMNRHEPTPQKIMGKTYDDVGEAKAGAVLADLAVHPSTARHISRKLARCFVSNEPPEKLVENLTNNFLESSGDLHSLASTMISDEACWSSERKSFLPPQDFLIATARAFPEVLETKSLGRLARQMGHPLWGPPSPEGYDSASDTWLGAEGLRLRLEIAKHVAARYRSKGVVDVFEDLFGEALSQETRTTISRAESSEQAVILAIMSPDFLRR